MTWYTPTTTTYQQVVADEATGGTVAVVYTSREDAVLIAYAPRMLAMLKASDRPEHEQLIAEIVYEQEQ